MPRSFTHRLRVATLLLAGGLTLSACGGESEATSVEPGSTAATPTAEATVDDTTGDDDAREAETPESVAQDFAVQALSDMAVLTAPDLQTGLTHVSPYLTAQMQNALLVEEPEHELDKWGIVPWRIEGNFDGGMPVAASATPVSSTAYDTQPNKVSVEVVVDFVWTYDNHGDISSTRTYRLSMVPGTQPGDLTWMVNGGLSSDSTFTN